MGGGTKTTQTSEQEQTRDPWAPAASRWQSQVAPLLDEFSGQPLSYTGPGYIGPTGTELAGRQGARDFLMGQGASMVNAGTGAWGQALDPMAFLRGPGAMSPLNIYAENVGRTLNENVRPGYAADAIAAGHTGGYSSRRALQDQRAARDASDSIARYGADLVGNLYGQGLQARQGALGMAPMMLSYGASPSESLMRLGAIERAELGAEDAAARAQAEFQQMEPFQRAQMLSGSYLPWANLGGTTVSTGTSTTQRHPSTMGQLMGLGMMGLGLASGNPMAAMGGAGALMGGSPYQGSNPLNNPAMQMWT